MSTFAILGATGSTGSSVLAQLLDERQSYNLHVYVRSKPKLEKQFSDIQNNKSVTVYEGLMNAKSLLPCLKDVDVIINTIGVNNPVPGQRIARDTAEAVIGALQSIIADNGGQAKKIPYMVYLSSASLNKIVAERESAIQMAIMLNGAYYVYEDMRQAIKYYQTEGIEKGLMTLSMVCPGAIHLGSTNRDTPAGRGIGVKLDEEAMTTMVTYSEVARGMVEMAEDPERWRGKEALVSSAQPPSWSALAMLIVTAVLPGLVITFIPQMYPIMTRLGVL